MQTWSSQTLDSLSRSAVALFDSAGTTGIAIHIAVPKRNSAEGLIPKYLAGRRFPVPAEVKTWRPNDEGMTPPVEDRSRDISFRIEA